MLRYRYLFSQLVRRELRQKYKGSALGVLWYLANPLMLMAVYGLMLHSVLKAVNEPDYPIFILAGLLAWLFFSQALLGAAGSLVEQSALVSKVRFPRETVPAASVTVQLVPFFAMLIVLEPVTLILRGNASVSLLLLPVVIACLFAFTLGLSMLASILHAYFRDVVPVLTAGLLPLFFISGVLFPLTSLPGLATHKTLEALLRWVNPVAPFVDATRSVVYAGHAPSAATLVYIVVAAVLASLLGVGLFRRYEGELAVVL
jgi:ABC-type polysaccharide/polyol phosphate export permease